jgi:hypothetical protein
MTEKAGELLRSYWPIIVALFAIAAAWGVSTAQIAGLADSNKAIMIELRENTRAVSAVQSTLAAQQAKTDAAAEGLADLRLRVREMERR